MTPPSKAAQLSADTALVAGIQKHLANTAFTVLSQPETSAQVVTVIQGRIDAAQAVLTAKSTFHQAVVASDAQDVTAGTFIKDVRQGIQSMFSNAPQILADFGMLPRKVPTPLTTAQKVVAAAKRAATRAARHTTGKVQKAKITGTLDGAVVVQPDGSSAVVPSDAGSSSAVASPAPATPAVQPASPPAAPAVTSTSTTPHV